MGRGRHLRVRLHDLAVRSDQVGDAACDRLDRVGGSGVGELAITVGEQAEREVLLPDEGGVVGRRVERGAEDVDTARLESGELIAERVALG